MANFAGTVLASGFFTGGITGTAPEYRRLLGGMVGIGAAGQKLTIYNSLL